MHTPGCVKICPSFPPKSKGTNWGLSLGDVNDGNTWFITLVALVICPQAGLVLRVGSLGRLVNELIGYKFVADPITESICVNACCIDFFSIYVYRCLSDIIMWNYVKLIQWGIVEYTWTHELEKNHRHFRDACKAFISLMWHLECQVSSLWLSFFSFIRIRSKSVACCTQLWPFISYNWIIHSINGVIRTYNWYFGP